MSKDVGVHAYKKEDQVRLTAAAIIGIRDLYYSDREFTNEELGSSIVKAYDYIKKIEEMVEQT